MTIKKIIATFLLLMSAALFSQASMAQYSVFPSNWVLYSYNVNASNPLVLDCHYMKYNGYPFYTTQYQTSYVWWWFGCPRDF